MGTSESSEHLPAVGEERVRAIGLELFEGIRRESGGVLSPERWMETLLERSLGDEDAKLQLFRFIDVLPALATRREIGRHLREYFDGRPAPFPALLHAARVIARVGWPGEAAVGTTLTIAVRGLARRFIAGSTPAEAIRAARRARRAGLAFTLDVLGEACVSEEEAEAYERRYIELVEHLGREAARWQADARLDRAPWGELPRVNISVKLSALYSHLDPIDPDGSAAGVVPRLRRIVAAARTHGAHIQVDMEERRLKDLTIAIFRALCEEPEIRDYRHVGLVLQAYLRDTERDATDLVDWARSRGTPVTVRLVKGAYWDYETAHAALEGWPVPVFEHKAETDASFERLTRFFLAHADVVDLADPKEEIGDQVDRRQEIDHAEGGQQRLQPGRDPRVPEQPPGQPDVVQRAGLEHRLRSRVLSCRGTPCHTVLPPTANPRSIDDGGDRLRPRCYTPVTPVPQHDNSASDG